MIDIVGVGDGDFHDLPAAMRTHISQARILIGSRRQLERIPQVPQQDRRLLPSPLHPGLANLLHALEAERGSDNDRTVMLASGDPLLSGIGSTVIGMLGAAKVRIHPWISSEVLARARMRWPADTTQIVTAVGRSIDAVRRHLTPDARLIVLCPDGAGPAALARLLVEEGCGRSRITAWWHLGGPDEGSRSDEACAWDAARTPDLVLACVEVDATGALARPSLGAAPGRAESAFEHDGQLTKRDARASALAHLRPTPGAHLWDLGAGTGTIGIDWALAEPRARVSSVEAKPERAQRIARNAVRLGVGALVTVVQGEATAQLHELDDPDAVFIGGGLSRELLEAAWERLPMGGRCVAHAVTLESEAVLVAAFSAHGGSLTRLSVEQAQPLGHYLAWTPLRPIVQWSAVKAAPLSDSRITGAEAGPA